MFDEKGPSFFELAEQALSSTTKGYDLLAPKFEYTPFRTPDELLGPLTELVAEEKVESALDVCCGTGAVMQHLQPICERRLVGIDLSEGMLAEARRQLGEGAPEDGPDVELIQQDVFEMEFDAEFDVITCCGAFGHILQHQQDDFAERVRNALRPGGRFLFVTRSMPEPLSKAWLFSRGFNAAMHVRNALVKPEFIMFYLTFTLERAERVLGRHGFELNVRAPFDADSDFSAYRLVSARI
ncbi:MAG: class I SAM-dependent methyltransferase [Myxococcota bacterium]